MSNPAPESPQPQSRFWQGYRFRRFMIISLAVHATIGLVWGLPGYVRMRKEDQAREQSALAAQRQRESNAQTLAKAKADALAQTRAELARSTRSTLDAIVKDLNLPQRDKLWEKVNHDLQAAQEDFAKALADRTHTEQDLRNIQADLSRQVVQIADAEMDRMMLQAAVDDYLGSIQSDIVPEMIRHYGERVRDHVGNPLRESANTFVNTTQTKAQSAANAARGKLEGAHRQLDGLRRQLEESLRATDPKAFSAKLAQAVGSAEASAKLVAEAAKAAQGNEANTDLVAGIGSATTQLAEIREKLATAQAVTKPADAANVLTGLLLTETKARASFARALDASYRMHEAAAELARGAVGGARDATLAGAIDTEFEKGFKSEVAPRLATKLAERFAKLLESRAMKLPPDQDLKVRVQELLVSKVGASGAFKTPGTVLLKDIVANRAAPAGESGQKLQSTFADAGQAIIVRGIAQTLANPDTDGWFVERARLHNDGSLEDDARYRLETLATNAREGRTVGMLDDLGASQLTGLREGALSRSVLLDQLSAAAARGAIGGGGAQSTTQPGEDPTLAQVREELLNALKFDFMSLLGGKLDSTKADTIWSDLQKATDKQIDGLAGQLLDPNVTDQDLEKNRIDFSLSFYEAMQGSLDKGASRDMTEALVKQIQGQLGDRMAGRYKDLVRDRVGGALQREFGESAALRRRAVDTQTRAINMALEGARDAVNRANEIAGQSRERVASAKDGAEAAKTESNRLGVVDEGLASAAKDFAPATRPAASLETVAGQLAVADTAMDTMTQEVQKAHDAAETGKVPETAQALDAARQAATSFNKAADQARDGLNRQGDIAVRGLAAAVRGSEFGEGDDTGIKGQVSEAFSSQFRKSALPRLTGRVTEAYKRRLQDAGLKVDLDDQQFNQQIADAFAKRVDGTALGDAAIGKLEEADFMRASNGATTRPVGEQAKEIRSVSARAIEAGAADAFGDGGVYDEAAQAVGGIGPNGAFGEIKGKVGQLAGALRGGTGGVLAGGDGEEGDQPAGGMRSLRGLRKRWQGMMAGMGHGAGTGAGAGAGAGAMGQGMGKGSGRGAGGRLPGSGFGMPAPRFDEAAYAKLIEANKDRDKKSAQLAALDRQGAQGDASRAELEPDALRPAMLLTPTTMPSAITRNDQPYKPSFKSIKFMSVPYLNTPFTIDGNFDKWKDIPSFELLPEKGDGQGIEGLRLVDRYTARMAWDPTGLYVMVDVVDADNAIRMATAPGSFAIADVAEIWVDTLNTKERQRARGAGQQFWVWPFGMEAHPEYTGGESTKDLNTNFMPTIFESNRLQRAAVKTADGYRLEFHLPMDRVRDAAMSAGRIVGFNMTVETGTKIHYYWSASKAVGTWGRPDTWGDVLLAGSDGKLEILEKLSLDRAAGEPDKVLKTFTIGEPLNIRVTDRDMNLRPSVRDKLSVTVKSAQGEQEIAILEETGMDSGVFEGSVRTGLNFGERVPGILSVYEGEKLAITYIDQARANGARNTELQYAVQAGTVVTAMGPK